tara:strand:- start:1706 stop:1894 length:189 start_codon:yes stop_codon:yes gene_type:complete
MRNTPEKKIGGGQKKIGLYELIITLLLTDIFFIDYTPFAFLTDLTLFCTILAQPFSRRPPKQ